MIIGTHNKLSELENLNQFTMNNEVVKFVKYYNYLGIVIYFEMPLGPLYKNLEKRIVNKVYMLRKL